MAPLPAPYSGTSTLALVARASAFTFGLAYGNIKLKYLRLWFELFPVTINWNLEKSYCEVKCSLIDIILLVWCRRPELCYANSSAGKGQVSKEG
nr:uncharacterized protein LOC104115733 isoform X2 [Nicotiana tomentosiformis]